MRNCCPYREALFQGRLLTPELCAKKLKGVLAAWYNASPENLTLDSNGLVSGARDLSGNGNNGSQSTAGNRLTFFPSDWRFGGKSSFGSTTATGGRHLATPSIAIANVIISAYYGTPDTIYSTFQAYHHLLAPATSLKAYSYLLPNSGGTTYYTNGLEYDASPSINGKATSTIIAPLPPSTMTHTRTLTSEVYWIGGDTTWANRVWIGAFRNFIFSSTALTTYQKKLIEGVIAWDGGHQRALAGNHPFCNRPPLIGD